MTRIAITSSAFFVISMMLLPCSMASAEVTGACLSDAQAKCPGVVAGGGKIRECLKTNFASLSDACQEVVLKGVAVKACEEDVKTLCTGVAPGEGRIEACMKAKKADVSDACKAALVGAVAGED